MIRYAGKMGEQPPPEPSPSVRPVHEQLELTVPEPSLVGEWNISDDEENQKPATSTQLNSAEKSVKFKLTPKRQSFEKGNILYNQTMPPMPTMRNPYYQQKMPEMSQSYYYTAPQPPQPPPPPPPQHHQPVNGMMELIEVIRKQEIEIHKQRTLTAKHLKQLKHQAELIQSLKSKVQKEVDRVSADCQTDPPPRLTDSHSQTAPTEPKLFADLAVQTQEEETRPRKKKEPIELSAANFVEEAALNQSRKRSINEVTRTRIPNPNSRPRKCENCSTK